MAKKKHANNPQKLDPDLELLIHKYARIYIDNPDELDNKLAVKKESEEDTILSSMMQGVCIIPTIKHRYIIA